MSRITRVALPQGSSLAAAARAGAYVDCYTTRIAAAVSQADFVEAFYTTWLFKIERHLLGVLASKPSSDSDARRLALGQTDRFSAWRVEARQAEQLLLADITGRTQSWLMAIPVAGDSSHISAATQLHFGSAVLPQRDRRGASGGTGIAFHALLGFHKIYSRCLLCAACSRLARRTTRLRPAGID